VEGELVEMGMGGTFAPHL
jgi:hypothetical protein